MSNFEELFNGFTTKQPDQWTFNPTHSQPKQTPEDKDLQRLESEIQGIFLSRRLLNKAVATLFAVVGSSAGIHLFARLGIPAIASGTIGGIVIAVCLGNALTKIRNCLPD
jgi:hypothetical protein